MGLRLTPPFWFLLALGAMVLIDRYTGGQGLIGGAWRAVGVGPIAVSGLLGLWGLRLFRRRGTTIEPGRRATRLVTDGPYRFTRNPMYLALALVLLGVGLLLGAGWALVVVPVFMILIEVLFIRPEEAMLREEFGDGYGAYRRGTRRWV